MAGGLVEILLDVFDQCWTMISTRATGTVAEDASWPVWIVPLSFRSVQVEVSYARVGSRHLRKLSRAELFPFRQSEPCTRPTRQDTGRRLVLHPLLTLTPSLTLSL